MSSMNAILKAKIEGIIYEVMVKTGAANIYVDETTTLAAKLAEIIADVDTRATKTELSNTVASGDHSHAEGFNTKASGPKQHVEGMYNVADSDGKYVHIVGNGQDGSSRSNAHTLDWSGNAWFAGNVEAKAIIVASSTSGSTKRFKITVNDEGALTATEVTA